MKVLVTRPAEDAAETSARLQEMGHEAIVAPVLNLRFEDGDPISDTGVQAWLATSRNGVRALVRRDARRDLPLLAVGRSTAALAQESGFTMVHDADGDVADLAALAARTLDPNAGNLFHAAGKEVAGDLPGELAFHGFNLERRVLYFAEPATSFTPEIREALIGRQIDAALFFSARSARVFATLAGQDEGISLALGQMNAICISNRAANGLEDLKWSAVRVADRPNQDALLAELDNHS